MKISRLTLTYSILLILSASFLRQVLNLFYKNMGRSTVVVLLWITFFLFGAFFIYLIVKNIKAKVIPISTKRIFIFLLVLAAGIYYASTFPVPEERIHLVKYGFLGYLIARDNFDKKGLWIIAIGLGYTLLVASIDEIFQYYLPTRVGDPRDVAFGGIGGIWGVSLFVLIFYGKKKG